MKQPVISVVTITRNDLSGLRRTVESVNAQDYGAIEHIIVDGGSSDGTIEWINSLTGNIHLLVGPDRGIYHGMNRGLDASSGSLVVWMNGGDTFTHCSDLATVAESHCMYGWPWAYGFARLMRNGTVERVSAFIPYRRDLFALGHKWIPHQATYVSRELAVEVGGYSEVVGVSADQDFLMRLAAVSNPRVIPEFVADFSLGGAHSALSGRARHRAWAEARQRSGLVVGGSRILDKVAAELVYVSREARQAVAGCIPRSGRPR